MFRGDAEFHEDAAPSHLGGGAHAQSQQAIAKAAAALPSGQASSDVLSEDITVAGWDAGAEKELKKIPFFVRSKARRNTEKYATERGISVITTETLYESKAYFSQS
jgi:light-independent protochlorophyllide reductase subunit B